MENNENIEQETVWEETREDNSVVKKYIVYVVKEFTSILDNLSLDERSAYINDCIQKKIDLESVKKQQEKKKELRNHLIITVLTFLILTPFMLLGVQKAIMLTFENYKYSEENFEKLYKQRFEKDKAYMRSVQYNKEHKNDKK